MRTTLNLDDDVARPLAELAKRSHRSMSRVANDLLRAGFRAGQQQPRMTLYEPAVFDTGEPLLDVTDIAEALELAERG